jgi:cytosine/uracil/thiamine/allantoin permease
MSELPPVSKLRTVGAHVELELGQDLADSPRYNDDIAPTQASQRTWSRWNVAAAKRSGPSSSPTSWC